MATIVRNRYDIIHNSAGVKTGPKHAQKQQVLTKITLLFTTPYKDQCSKVAVLKWQISQRLYTVSQKVPTFKLSVTLSNLNRCSKFLHCWKVYEIDYKTIWHYPHYLRHVVTLRYLTLDKLIIRIFWRWKKMQTRCIWSAPILILLRT